MRRAIDRDLAGQVAFAKGDALSTLFVGHLQVPADRLVRRSAGVIASLNGLQVEKLSG
jgi:hypothetical protein